MGAANGLSPVCFYCDRCGFNVPYKQRAAHEQWHADGGSSQGSDDAFFNGTVEEGRAEFQEFLDLGMFFINLALFVSGACLKPIFDLQGLMTSPEKYHTKK